MTYYKINKFELAIPYFENIVYYYPLEVGKYHAYLAICYFNTDNIEKTHFHYNQAKNIISNNKILYELELILFDQKGLD